MADCAFDVAGIGNAIVDVLSHADDAKLHSLGVSKGVMTLIDSDQAEKIYAQMGPGVECSGGSAANTIAGVAGLGGKGAYIGKVRNDQLGQVFRHDLRSLRVAFDTADAVDGAATARCLILVTPDAQRSMLTYLGACVSLGPDDIDPTVIANAQVTYLEGYLWDPPQAKEAFRKAARIAHEAGRKVALSLSDPFCVDRHRAEFLELLADHVDIVFANEAEITSLYQTDLDDALRQVREHCDIAAITRSEKGSVVIAGEQVVVQGAEPVSQVVDTTGAGDLYAAGFLYGLTQGRDLGTAARLGGICAAEIISHVGARPEADLAKLVAHTSFITV
ncbi:MAG TPA: adenosine kinase [Candidatus Sulfotelmatobacter sp.]|jgi:sugar/nucleoside kinase (ribokinase family)|nr:adenosine kinase [Candidatus Sulfotelmatobacter sp.]